MKANVRSLAWLVVLPVLALASAFTGARTREVASAAAGSTGSTVSSASLTSIYFAAGTTQIRPVDTKILDAHAAWLRGDRIQRLRIEGHTDGFGESAFSRQVGEERAKSAKAYLVARGVPADHIAISSRGGGWPVCAEKTATCRAANRRVTFSTGVQP
jgi:outer membrane protein OmpA-like peptidoglycan-associated protein